MDLKSATLHVYPLDRMDASDLDARRTCLRRISHNGRSGWLMANVHGGIVLGPHNLADAEGSLMLWVMPVEDIVPAVRFPQHSKSLEHADEFTLISDREYVHGSHAAHFAITGHSYWHPGFWVKRFKGFVYEAYKGEPKACAAAGHFGFSAGVWYQIVYTWKGDEHRLFVNGVRVAAENQFRRGLPLHRDTPGPFLCAGSTLFAICEVRCLSRSLEDREVDFLYETTATDRNEARQVALRTTYEASILPLSDFAPGPDWSVALESSLTDPDDLRLFHVQGCPNAPSISEDGLRITTPDKEPLHDFSVLDLNHVYLWSRQWFEGDLHVSFRFRTLRKGGLSLLMTQCAGMQREDFLEQHPMRTNGTMTTVCWEDVRNYHWEFYREMNDVRNDMASHAILKNPWFRPIGFGVSGPLFELGEWQQIEFLQQGGRIRAICNGRVIIDTIDDPHTNSGPVLHAGRLAIRCMTRTDVQIRDLVVRTRPLPFLRG